MTEASQQPTRIADAVSGHWVERLVPPSTLPYAQLIRLERPIGWWLLLIPCWWGMLLAQISMGGGNPNWAYAALFLIGAIVMRGAGCVLNDMADRDFDRQVARTRERPLASGRVSVRQAFAFLVVLSLIGLLILLQFNWFTVILGASSLLIVAIYPLMKRITYWPQLVLGFAFNWGALVGWSAVTGSLTTTPLLLYAGGILWTLAYDTIYAHQDKDDDLLIGVKSTALKFGASSRIWIAAFLASSLAAITLAAVLAGGGPASYLGIAAAAVHAVRQVLTFDMDDAQSCLRLFRSNRNFGLLIAAGFLLDTLTR